MLCLFHQEEIAKLQRKVERSKKIEMAGGADEVLLAEIAEYKVGNSINWLSLKAIRKTWLPFYWALTQMLTCVLHVLYLDTVCVVF